MEKYLKLLYYTTITILITGGLSIFGGALVFLWNSFELGAKIFGTGIVLLMIGGLLFVALDDLYNIWLEK